MQGTVKIRGLKSAMSAMRAAFPDSPRKQRSLLNQAMSGAARKSIIPEAKRLALNGDGSGSLSAAIAPRAMSLSRARRRGKTAAIEITPVRSNRKAIALYIDHYYTRRGKAAPSGIVSSGIRHGHLVEFGTVHSAASPFMWPALATQTPKYTSLFAATLKKKIEAAVRRKAKGPSKTRKGGSRASTSFKVTITGGGS